MLETAWLFIGAIAFGWTVVTLAVAIYADVSQQTGDGIAMLGGIVGFTLWAVWTFGALDITVVGESVTYQFSHPELAIVGVAMSLIPGYIALTGPIELVARARDPEMRDV